MISIVSGCSSWQSSTSSPGRGSQISCPCHGGRRRRRQRLASRDSAPSSTTEFFTRRPLPPPRLAMSVRGARPGRRRHGSHFKSSTGSWQVHHDCHLDHLQSARLPVCHLAFFARGYGQRRCNCGVACLRALPGGAEFSLRQVQQRRKEAFCLKISSTIEEVLKKYKAIF